jgi:hypothetical protein
MQGQENGPRALFYSGIGQRMLPDGLVCSGSVPSSLDGNPCPYSESGRMPRPEAVGPKRALESPEVGRAGDRAPPCAVRHYGSLAEWLGPNAGGLSAEVLKLRLFECRQRFLLVIPGIEDQDGSADEPQDAADGPSALGEA